MKKQTLRRNTNQKSSGRSAKAGSRLKARFTPPPALLRGIAYTMIAIAVIASWKMTPVPVAAGFTILAVVRIGITLREDRLSRAGVDSDTKCSLSSS